MQKSKVKLPPQAEKEVAKLYTQTSGEEANLFIYGYIGDSWGVETPADAITAINVRKELDKLKNAGVKIVNARINSLGGYTSEGLAIITAFKESDLEIHTWNDGNAYSMAADIWFCVPTERRHMAKTASLMIHAPSSGISFYGTAKQMREAVNTVIEDLTRIAEMLDAIADGTIEVMAEGTGLSKDEIKTKFYDYADHTMTYQDCVDAGFISPVDAYNAEPSVAKTAGVLDKIKNFFSPNQATDKKVEGGPDDIDDVAMNIDSIRAALKAGTLTLDEVAVLVKTEQEAQPVTPEVLKQLETSLMKKVDEEVGKRDVLIIKLQEDLAAASLKSGGTPPIVETDTNTEGANDPSNTTTKTPEDIEFEAYNEKLIAEKRAGRA
jgi:ATP-dependent Clp protease, protease subunit